MSAPSGDSIRHVYDRHRGMLGELIAEAVERSGTELSAPSVIDLILWNVVIAYFVSLSANASYGLIKSKLSKNGRLDQGSLAEVSDDLTLPATFVASPTAATADQIVAVLIEFNVPKPTAKELAEKIVGIISPASPS